LAADWFLLVSEPEGAGGLGDLDLLRLEDEDWEEMDREGEVFLRLEVELALESVGCRLGTERKVGAGVIFDSSSSSSTSLKGRVSCRSMMSKEES
jgi:hypothetical protein